MSNEKNAKYDLEERTAVFGESIIDFARLVPQTVIATNLIIQLIKSGTSIGANYCEADCAESKKDFVHKLGICRKESKETKYWLRMISRTVPELKTQARICWREANELNLIFSAIIKKTKATMN